MNIKILETIWNGIVFPIKKLKCVDKKYRFPATILAGVYGILLLIVFMVVSIITLVLAWNFLRYVFLFLIAIKVIQIGLLVLVLLVLLFGVGLTIMDDTGVKNGKPQHKQSIKDSNKKKKRK